MRMTGRLAVRSVMIAGALLAVLPMAGAGASPAHSPGEPGRAAPPTALPAPVVTSATDLGAATQSPYIDGRDGNESTLFNGKSVWTFGDTPLNTANASGAFWDNNTMAWTTDLDGSQGLDLVHDVAGSNGVPIQVLPNTPAEKAFNAEHAGSGTHCEVQPCGLEYSVWNAPLVTDTANNRMLSFYSLVERPVDNTWKLIGTGIATISATGKVVRPIEDPGSSFPTLLFQNSKFAANAALIQDGDLYAYFCRTDFLTEDCLLGRAPVADAFTRSAWTWATSDGSWTDLADAQYVFHGGSAGSNVVWDPGLSAYLATFMPPESNELLAEVAPTLWGPWSAPTTAFTGIAPPAGYVDYAGWAHPEFASDDGLTQYVAYYHPEGGLDADTRWVQVTFAPTT
jgi:hypothetical protein